MVSLVAFDVQIAVNLYSLAAIDALCFIGAVDPQWCIQVYIVMFPGRRLVDDLEGWLGGERQSNLGGSGGQR